MLEQLVPKDHLLRKIDKYIDFSFIRELTKDLPFHLFLLDFLLQA